MFPLFNNQIAYPTSMMMEIHSSKGLEGFLGLGIMPYSTQHSKGGKGGILRSSIYLPNEISIGQASHFGAIGMKDLDHFSIYAGANECNFERILKN